MVNYTQSPLLASLRGVVPEPPEEARSAVAEQIVIGLENYYCHLPQKRAAFGIDPVAQLRILADDPRLNFTRRLLEIVNGLRDRHTTLRLPPPWSSVIAYVPLMIERIYAEAQPRYIVTKQLYGYDEIPVGSTITHWNGAPIHLRVNALAQQMQGASWAASTRLALANLTIRPLAYVLMPEEDWVTFTYVTPAGETCTTATAWRFFVQSPQGSAASLAAGQGGVQLGLDERTSVVNKVKSTASGPVCDMIANMTTKGPLRWGTVETPSGRCGYLRIFSFEVPDAMAFVKEIAEILQSLPQERLILDVRENPGGLIPAGQMLIRLLSEGPLTPAPVAFRATRGTLSLTSIAQFAEWHPSLSLQQTTADVFSQAFPIASYYDGAPDYRYPGRTVLVIDALCYSTTDFFAADFADNGIGPIIGTDTNTGGGGANVWPWDTLVQFAAFSGARNRPQALPSGFSLNISMRRALRTGALAGLAIEDLGVRADRVHHLTERDLTDGNADLIESAAAMLV